MFLSLSGRLFIFITQIISSLSQKFFKIDVLKTHRKTNLLESLFNQSAARYFMKTRLRHRCFIVNFVKTFKISILQNTFGRVSIFMEHICNIKKPNFKLGILISRCDFYRNKSYVNMRISFLVKES